MAAEGASHASFRKTEQNMKSSKYFSEHRVRNRSGFTLVELLVVIAIIGVLVAITIPAIGGAREAARRNQCLANQRSWGQAMQQHDSAKQYLPGRVTQIRNNNGDFINISWMHKLLPYMDQQNVYDALLLPTSFPYLDISQAPQKWSDVNDPNKAVPLVTLEPAICPSGRTVAGGLRGETNFVMNSGMSDAAAAGATRYDPNLERDIQHFSAKRISKPTTRPRTVLATS